MFKYIKLILQASDQGRVNDSPLITIIGSTLAIVFFYISIFKISDNGIASMTAKVMIFAILLVLPVYFIYRAIILIITVIKKEKEKEKEKFLN